MLCEGRVWCGVIHMRGREAHAPRTGGAEWLRGVELRLLRYALTVESCGSISAAANLLRIEPSAVSRGVRVLEERLGFPLFDRSHRGAVPSAAGAIYLKLAREALKALECAEATARSVSNGLPGLLRLGFVWSFGFGPIVNLLQEFGRRQPTVEVQLVEDGPDALIARLHDRKVDVALTAIEPAGYDPVRPIGNLCRLTLWTEHLLAAMPRAEARTRISWGELSERKLMCRTSDDFRGYSAFVERIGGPTLRFFPQHCSREGLLGLVAAGHGWTIIPESLAECEVEGVTLVPIEANGAVLQIEALWRADNKNPALRTLLKIARTMRRVGDEAA